MKVLQVIPEFKLAGAETMCENLLSQLKERGIDVVAVSLFRTESAITLRLQKRSIPIVYLDKHPGFDLSLFRKLWKLFRKEKPDVVHTHLYAMKYAVPVALVTGVKVKIHTVHNIAQKEATPITQKLNRLLYRAGLVIPVALSKDVQQTILDVYRLKRENVPIILNGSDLKRCIPKDYDDHPETVRFLHIGRFSPQKNHTMLIAAFEKFHKAFPRTELYLFGEGELMSETKRQVEQAGLEESVRFRGLTDWVYPELHDADVFVLPSLYEGIPMTLIEAMGTGLPVIATKVGGVPDMITNGEEGILTEPDVEQIAEAMTMMMDASLRRRYGEHGRKRALEQFTSETMAERYWEEYRRLMQ